MLSLYLSVLNYYTALYFIALYNAGQIPDLFAILWTERPTDGDGHTFL